MITIKTPYMLIQCEKKNSFVDATPSMGNIYFKFADKTELFVPNEFQDTQALQAKLELIKTAAAEDITVDLTDTVHPVKFGQ